MRKLLLILLGLNLVYGACIWNIQEKKEDAFSELDEKITFSFKDATTCEPIVGAKIYFVGMSLITDKKGHITIPVPSDIENTFKLKATKTKYITLKQNIEASSDTFMQTRFLMSKEIIGGARFVLSWDKNPSDLDLHLIYANNHISYRNKHIGTNAKLDIDDTDGYGPETISASKIDENISYKLFVHKYSGSGKIDKKAYINVYKNKTLDKTIYLKNTSSSCVQVLEVINNKIIYNVKNANDDNCQ